MLNPPQRSVPELSFACGSQKALITARLRLGKSCRASPARADPLSFSQTSWSCCVERPRARLGMLARLFLQRHMLVCKTPAGDAMLRACLLQAPCVACLLRQRSYATASQRKHAQRNWQGHLFPEWSGRGSVAAGAGRSRRSPSRQSDPLYDNAPRDVIILEGPPPAGAQTRADVTQLDAPPPAVERARRAQPERREAAEATASASALARAPRGGAEAESGAHGAAAAERGGGAEGGSEVITRAPRRPADPFQALGADDRVTVRLPPVPVNSGKPLTLIPRCACTYQQLVPSALDNKLSAGQGFCIQ